MSDDSERDCGSRGVDAEEIGQYLVGVPSCLIDATRPPRAEGPPYAECVQCRKPTEYPESYRGITLCPVCEWQEAQRTACSG